MSESATIHEQIAAVERALAMVREFAGAGEGLLGDAPTLRTIAGLEGAIGTLHACLPLPTQGEANVPPADELFALRAKVKTLNERDKELRELMISDKSARTGNHWVAELREVETSRVDLKELRACHADLVAEFTFPSSTTQVVLKEINEDGEAPPDRRPKRKAE